MAARLNNLPAELLLHIIKCLQADLFVIGQAKWDKDNSAYQGMRNLSQTCKHARSQTAKIVQQISFHKDLVKMRTGGDYSNELQKITRIAVIDLKATEEQHFSKAWHALKSMPNLRCLYLYSDSEPASSPSLANLESLDIRLKLLTIDFRYNREDNESLHPLLVEHSNALSDRDSRYDSWDQMKYLTCVYGITDKLEPPEIFVASGLPVIPNLDGMYELEEEFLESLGDWSGLEVVKKDVTWKQWHLEWMEWLFASKKVQLLDMHNSALSDFSGSAGALLSTSLTAGALLSTSLTGLECEVFHLSRSPNPFPFLANLCRLVLSHNPQECYLPASEFTYWHPLPNILSATRCLETLQLIFWHCPDEQEVQDILGATNSGCRKSLRHLVMNFRDCADTPAYASKLHEINFILDLLPFSTSFDNLLSHEIETPVIAWPYAECNRSGSEPIESTKRRTSTEKELEGDEEDRSLAVSKQERALRTVDKKVRRLRLIKDVSEAKLQIMLKRLELWYKERTYVTSSDLPRTKPLSVRVHVGYEEDNRIFCNTNTRDYAGYFDFDPRTLGGCPSKAVCHWTAYQ